MAITPNTTLKLLKVPLGLDYKHQLTFENENEQFEYFNSLPSYEINEISYQRKNSVLAFPDHIDNLLEYNYCMYQNENYSDKWFYAFITNMTYESDYTTYINLITDVFQTWQFNITFNDSFIEREMINVNEDLIGANRLQEGLETGEYIIKEHINIHSLQPIYIIAYTGDYFYDFDENNNPIGFTVNQKGYKYNGIYSGVTFIACKEEGFKYLMSKMHFEDNSNHILTIFTVPKFTINGFDYPENYIDSNKTWETKGFQVLDFDNMTESYTLNLFEALTENDDFENYIPKNKKLLSYPFIYLGFNAPTGTNKIYRFEDFHQNKPEFDAISEINPNPTVCIMPNGYRRKNKAYAKDLVDMVSLNGYPTISYKNDNFNIWMAQNSNILELNMAREDVNYQGGLIQNIANVTGTALNTGMSIANNLTSKKPDITGAIEQFVSAGYSAAETGISQGISQVNHELNIKTQLAQIEKQRLLPDKAILSGNNATLLGYDLQDECTFTVYCIRKEFAERIDKFFDMYGYLTNTVKKPNLNNRPNWNYIKTIGANITGNIHQEDLQILKDMFDNGITLWHNPTTFLDYSQNNR